MHELMLLHLQGDVLRNGRQIDLYVIRLGGEFQIRQRGMLDSGGFGGAKVSGHADGGGIGSTIRVEQKMGDGAFAVGRHGEERAGGAAVPEAHQIVAVAQEHHCVVRPEVRVVGFPLLGGHEESAGFDVGVEAAAKGGGRRGGVGTDDHAESIEGGVRDRNGAGVGSGAGQQVEQFVAEEFIGAGEIRDTPMLATAVYADHGLCAAKKAVISRMRFQGFCASALAAASEAARAVSRETIQRPP